MYQLAYAGAANGVPARKEQFGTIFQVKRNMSTTARSAALEMFLENHLDSEFLSDYPLILTEGGDDRLPLDPKSGTNKYHAKPEVLPKDASFRGSCTCNSPT